MILFKISAVVETFESCRYYGDYIEVWLVHLKCSFNCDYNDWSKTHALSEYKT